MPAAQALDSQLTALQRRLRSSPERSPAPSGCGQQHDDAGAAAETPDLLTALVAVVTAVVAAVRAAAWRVLEVGLWAWRSDANAIHVCSTDL